MSKEARPGKDYQAVILAAGASTRCWPLNKKHKSLFEVTGKPLICHTLENLRKAGVKDVVIVQGQKKDIEQELKKHDLPSGLKIKYVTQQLPKGTGDALKSAEKHLKDRFLVLYGDDFYGVGDLKSCLQKFPSILVKEVDNPSSFGVIVLDKNYVKGIIEKPKNPPSNLVNAGGFFVPKTILEDRLLKSKRGEYEVTDYINKLCQKSKMHFSKSKEWSPLPYSWHLLDVNRSLIEKIKLRILGKAEKNCQLKGNIFVGKDTVVKSGAYIEGPVYIGENCQIGPNCRLRPFTFIADNCVVGQGSEIKNSIIAKGSKIGHLSYLGDSIVGHSCNLGAGTVLANKRLDDENIRARINGKIVDTGRKKFGSVLGDNVKVGVNSSIMPGVLIGSDSLIGPHSLVRRNVEANTLFYTKFQGVAKKKNAV